MYLCTYISKSFSVCTFCLPLAIRQAKLLFKQNKSKTRLVDICFVVYNIPYICFIVCFYAV